MSAGRLINQDLKFLKLQPERKASVFIRIRQMGYFISEENDFSKNIKIEIYDASGKLLSAKSEMKDSSTLLDIQYAPSGSYLLNVVEDDQPIISQKIIKE
jgi:hypothetical protein